MSFVIGPSDNFGFGLITLSWQLSTLILKFHIRSVTDIADHIDLCSFSYYNVLNQF